LKKRTITEYSAVAILALLAGGAGWGWYAEHQHAASLETQLKALKAQEVRSAVVRSVSRQLEEIAVQQRNISDEQRMVALQEKRNADEMRLRSEVARQHALLAQQQAVASEQQAQEARQVAENERQTAERQRIEAEYAKRVADTLTYQALGRSLGSLSTIQEQSGNNELADLLAYASYEYSRRYNGDIYYPAVFRAITQSSQSQRTWSIHSGTLSCIAFPPKTKERFVTASTFGEVTVHQRKADGSLTSTVRVRNADYDFRDLYIAADGTAYVLSRSGHLIILGENEPQRVVELKTVAVPIAISSFDKGHLLIIGDSDLALFDMGSNTVVNHRRLNFKVVTTGRADNHPLLFDDKGNMHLLTTFDATDSRRVPVSGQVTAFAESKNTHVQTYGMSDGAIYLVDKNGKVTKLVGHLSRISKLKVNGSRLYSSSDDGTLRLWMTNVEKIDPITLITLEQWITNFTFDNEKQYLCVGDRDGNLSMTLMSVPTMMERIRHKLKRDFTDEEWTYYIGTKIPYEPFYSNSRKEVTP